MKEKILGTVISVFIHLCVVLPILAVSFAVSSKAPVKTVEIDFSLVRDQGHEIPTGKINSNTVVNKPRMLKDNQSSNRSMNPGRSTTDERESAPAKEHMDLRPAPAIVSASDAQGTITVHGTPATYTGSSGSARFIRLHGGMPGSRSADGRGSGGGQGGEGFEEAGENFNYIRDAIMKNIRYPDRARRLGLEGKVTLSFVVLESGVTSDVRVISSSGHRILDENAKEAAASTRVSVKTSGRVAVKLPITYKLQSQESSRQ